MCGIAGWLTFSATVPSEAVVGAVRAALPTLAKRGPDAQRAEALPGAVLGHTRLSILDLREAAHQPMADPTGRYWLAFNGEIFNYRDLKNSAIAYRTTSDTEVLLHHLIQKGAAGLNELNGFFALAFYDTQTGRLLLARDRFGIKPLVYAQSETGFRFASEAKALLAMGVPAALNRAALGPYFQLNYLPPGTHLLQGVETLLPGHYLEVSRSGLGTSQPFYHLPPPAPVAEVPSYEAAQAQLRSLLEDAVRLRLVSDVPLGVFLSGGIDSSVVAALAKRHTNDLRTFSIGFEEKIWDETAYAQLVAKHIGSQHTVFRLSADDLYAHLEGALGYFSEPFADPSALNVYILSQHTRKHVTVALSGDGADELFAGYHRHLGEAVAARYAPLAPLARLSLPLVGLLPDGRGQGLGRRVYQLKRLLRAMVPAGARYRTLGSILSTGELVKLVKGFDATALNAAWAPLVATRTAYPGLNGFLRADMRLVLAGDMLVKVDQMSMAHSLEVRPPFLDYRVVDFAFRLPVSYKLRGRQRKRIVQDAFRADLPAELYHRPKQGFEVPLTSWFLTALRSRIENEFLNREFVEAQGLFHYEALQGLWQRIQQRRGGKDDWSLWAYIVFQHWYKRVLGS